MNKLAELVTRKYDYVFGRLSGWTRKKFLLPKENCRLVVGQALNETITPLLEGRSNHPANEKEMEAMAKRLIPALAKQAYTNLPFQMGAF